MTVRIIPDLMWVTDRKRSKSPLSTVARLAVAGGVTAVHIREKDLDRSDLLRLATSIIDAIGDEATVIINSSAEVARDLGIGLHLPEHAPMPDGEPFVLTGRSVHSTEAAEKAIGVDYLIAGHVFDTGSKAGLPPIGPIGLRRIVASTSLPLLAIGGIRPENAQEALSAGAFGLAVMSGIGSAADPEAAAGAFRAEIDRLCFEKSKEY